MQPAQSAKPIANADHVRVVAGSKAVVSPLDNDTSPSGGTLRLAAVHGAARRTSIAVDQQAGVFTFSTDANAQAQTYYLTYDVMDGANTAQGIVRVDVTPKATPPCPPRSRTTPPCCATAARRPSPRSPTTSTLRGDPGPAVGQDPRRTPGHLHGRGPLPCSQISAASTVPANLTVEYTVTNGTVQRHREGRQSSR